MSPFVKAGAPEAATTPVSWNGVASIPASAASGPASTTDASNASAGASPKASATGASAAASADASAAASGGASGRAESLGPVASTVASEGGVASAATSLSTGVFSTSAPASAADAPSSVTGTSGLAASNEASMPPGASFVSGLTHEATTAGAIRKARANVRARFIIENAHPGGPGSQGTHGGSELFGRREIALAPRGGNERDSGHLRATGWRA